MTVTKMRADQIRRINENPATVAWQVVATVPDGEGGYIPNPRADAASESYYVNDVRIAKMDGSISDKKGTEASFGYSQPLLLTAKYNTTWITNGMIIEYNERRYRVEDIQAVTYRGAIISKIAKLTDVTSSHDVSIVIGADLWTEPSEEEVVLGG